MISPSRFVSLATLCALAGPGLAENNLIPTDTIPGMSIPPGTLATIIADSSSLKPISPTALTHGSDGTIYLSETHRFRFGIPDNRGHLYWVVDDTASRTTADRMRMYEKWQNKSEENSLAARTEKSEIVRALSKPNPSGAYTKQQVSADGFNDALDGTAAGIFEYEGTVYLACIPKIYALRDTDGDGTADERKVIQDGFGVHVSLSGHDLNGFVLGPDGRIYGSMGDRGFNGTTKEGVHYNLHDEGFVFRFDPDGSNFEVIHTGLRNPKEIAFDDHGNLFTVDNNCDQGDKARIVYIVDGANSGWHMGHQILTTFKAQAGLEKRTPVSWLDEKLWHLPNEEQPAFLLPPIAHLTSGPSGLAYHPGAGFLESEVGRFFICDYRGGAANSSIWSFKMEPSGAGMKMANAHQLNTGAAVTDVDFSWDGKLVVSDFVGGWTSHADGRVYSLEAEQPFKAAEAQQAAQVVKEGFSHRSPEELGTLLSHPDQRIRIRAQLELTRRPEGFDVLAKAVGADNEITQLHGVWGLGVIARRSSAVLPTGQATKNPALREKAAQFLRDLTTTAKSEEVRCQAIKAIGEAGIEIPLPFNHLVQSDNPRIQFFATIAAGRLKAKEASAAIIGMIAKSTDLHLRLAGAHALSLTHKSVALERLANHPSTAVRLAAVIALRKKRSDALATFLGNSEPEVVDEAIRAINDLQLSAVRGDLATLLDNSNPPERSAMIWQRILHSAFRIGGAENAKRLLATALNTSLPEGARAEAFRLIGQWTNPHPIDQSTGRYAPVAHRPESEIRPLLDAKILPIVSTRGALVDPALKVIRKYNLDLSPVPGKLIRAIVFNKEIPDSARVDGLQLYIARGPDDLNALIDQLITGPNDALAIAALEHLAATNPTKAVEALSIATKSASSSRQQQAWTIASKIELPSAAELIADGLKLLKEQNGTSPGALELLEAAATRKEETVAKALADFQQHQTESNDPLAKWLTALEGGDSKRGAELFNSHPAGQCKRCHAAGHGGGNAGPRLASIGREKDRRYILEAIVQPGATVAMGYGIASATLKGGKVVGGIVVDETSEHVDFDSGGTIKRVLRKDIDSMTPPISAMPPMEHLLKPDEVRDLVEWLSNRKLRPIKPPERPEPILVKP